MGFEINSSSHANCPSPKKILRLLKEALADGIHVFVAGFGELLQLGFLRVSQMRWHFHVDADMQVALTVALDVLDSFAA